MVTVAEQKILDAVDKGAWAIFTADEQHEVSAEFLRRVLLGLENVTIRAPGMRIRGARVTGSALDLTGCGGCDGDGLPPLALENSSLPELNFENSVLAQLSLVGSSISVVHLFGARIKSGFNFSGVRGYTKHAVARINGRGCTIDGEIRGEGAKLRAPRPRDHFPNGQEFYALCLRDAKIRGTFYLVDGFEAWGGVRLSAARIGGDIFAYGAVFSAGEGEAFRAQGMRLDGLLVMTKSNIAGTCSLLGAHLGTLDLRGAKLSEGHKTDGNGALIAMSAEIRGDVNLDEGFVAAGEVSFLGATITGTLRCVDGIFSNPGGHALYAFNAKIGGSVLFDGLLTNGEVCFLNARMTSLQCMKAKLRNDASGVPGVTLNLCNATIERSTVLDELQSIGQINLWGAHVGGDLKCSGVKFVYWIDDFLTQNQFTAALDATNATIGGDVCLDRHARVIGDLWFEHARIRGTFKWQGLEFVKELTLERVFVEDGEYSEEKTRWGYSGELEGKTPAPNISDGRKAQLVLAHANIAAALQAYELTAEVPLRIDLSAASVHTLDDDANANGRGPAFPAGWGGDNLDVDKTIELDLDGFIYKRIDNFPTPRRADFKRVKFWVNALTPVGYRASRSATQRKIDIVAERKRWLDFQDKGKFYPQPFRHLAAMMRAQGHVQEARQIAIAEQNATPSRFWWLKRPLFGWCFGYGLEPLQATVTLLLMLAATTILVWSAWTATFPILVLSPNEVEARGALNVAGPILPNSPELRCGANEIIPMLYALDMMLPIVPLHQEDRCEISTAAPWYWAFTWALFSLVGKLVTSVSLITFSGVLKPRD